MAVTWLGHSTVLVELDGIRILTDPVLGPRVGPLVRIAPPVPADAGMMIDAVAISHLHADHAHIRSLRMLDGSPRMIAPRGAARWLARHGLAAQEISPGEHTSVGAVRVTATDAAHDPRALSPRPLARPCGYLIEGSQCCYFAGDTDLFDGMADLAGRVDLALLPIWGWGPKLGPGHLDPDRAVQAAASIGPRVVVPIHWGTYGLPGPARGRADPGAPAARFKELMARELPAVEVRVLSAGQRTVVEAAAPSGAAGAA
ncbi:MAG: MBL fold metallo-hydrolase [Solirubrobacteraceae bacterium]